ncbi:MAG: pyrroline-5-carboxylate reductase, partial [Pseudomonadota bacterium]
RVVRVMPNTPALVGRGMSVCFANEHVSEQQRHAIDGLMAAVGEVAWIDHESQMDAVTGVSGSGPAYVFHLAEALAAAGVEAGLDAKLADQLARATVSGAGELMRQSSDDPATLRRNVTSPNGTTQAALEVLMGDGGFPDVLPRAVKAAADRSRELAKE